MSKRPAQVLASAPEPTGPAITEERARALTGSVKPIRPAYRPLQRELPQLYRSGAIKFRAVIGMARAQRQIRLDCEARGLTRRSDCRLARVQEDMTGVRSSIADLRAFHSVTNLPVHEYEQVRVECFGHSWIEARPVAAEPAALQEAA